MKNLIGLATLFACCLGFHGVALALGLGGYLEGGGGTARVEHPNSRGSTDDSQVDAAGVGAGFALDTAVRGPQIFNYRLHVGFDAQGFYDNDDRYVEIGGVAIDNIFGFAVLRTDKVRMWLGPTLRLGYYRGHLYDEDRWRDSHRHHDDDEVGDYRAYTVGVGLAVGANFAVGRTFSICPTVGYRYARHFGSWSTDSDYGSRDGDARGWTSMGYAGVDFLFDLP